MVRHTGHRRRWPLSRSAGVACHSCPQAGSRHQNVRREPGDTVVNRTFWFFVGCHWEAISGFMQCVDGSISTEARRSPSVFWPRQDGHPERRKESGVIRGWCPRGQRNRLSWYPPATGTVVGSCLLYTSDAADDL